MTGEGAWPYLLLLIAAVLPNESFRIAAVLLSRGLDESSELFTWIRIVALALLSAVVSKIVVSQPAALAAFPLYVPIAAVAAAVAAFFAMRRSLVAAIATGEAVFVGLAALSG